MISPNPLDRLLESVRAIIRQELPYLKMLGTWEYRVSGVNGDDTINASPTDESAGLPPINNMALRAGPDGSKSTPTIGNTCDVRFINGDPTRPAVVGNGALVRTVTVDATDTVSIGASVSNAVVLAGGSAPIARMGDAVTVYFPLAPMLITGILTPGVPPVPGTFTGTLTIAQPATGVITTGQPKVVA